MNLMIIRCKNFDLNPFVPFKPSEKERKKKKDGYYAACSDARVRVVLLKRNLGPTLW